MKNKVISLFGNNKMVQNKVIKYSVLLEQFMTPFAKEFEDIDFFEDFFEFAINAWNFGNMKLILPKSENEDITNYIEEEAGVGVDLLNKMIDYKFENFKEYTNFIVDYELKETSGDPILSTITQTEEDYLDTIINSIDDQVTQDDFEENYVNRYAIIVKPLQPFIDWFNTLYPEDSKDTSDFDEPNIYLINEQIDDLENWIKKKYDKLFKIELEGWHTNKKEWPQKRNYKMFKQWFQVDVSTMIYDLERKPVLKLE